MGTDYSKEVEPDIQEAVDDFVSKSLHRCQENVFTKVSDVVSTARRMLRDIDHDSISTALLHSLGTRFVRYTIKDDEPVPDIILNHKLLDVDFHGGNASDQNLDSFELVETK